VNTDADNTQNKTTNVPSLIEEMKWEVNNRITRPQGGYYPDISLSDIDCEITRTVTQVGSVNLEDVSNLDCPEDDVYEWDYQEEDTEHSIWRISGMVRKSDYSDLLSRYERLCDLARTTTLMLGDYHTVYGALKDINGDNYHE